MSWWIWVLLGLLLMVLEAITPGGFFVIFFGVGALLVGLMDLAGLHSPLLIQGVSFVAISVLATALFRKPLLERFHKLTPKNKVDSLIGETAHASEDIPAKGFGKVELRGTSWSVHNAGENAIPRGGRCRVEHVDGLTLTVRG